MDYWSAFARTRIPNAEKGYLEARGFRKSSEKMTRAEMWIGDGKGIMRLQWSGLGLDNADKDVLCCKELGLGRDFYETFDYGDDGNALC